MAKNWRMNELVSTLTAGRKEDLIDLGKRFPLTVLAAKVAMGNEGAETIFNALPDHVSIRKVENILRGDVEDLNDAPVNEEVESDVDSDEVAVEDDKKAKAKARRERRKAKKEAVKEEGKEKPSRSRRSKKANKVEVEEDLEDEVEDDSDDEVVEENPYEGKSAKALYKECKARGIEAKSKQDKEYYVDLLVKDDNKEDDPEEADTDEVEDDEDEWDI